MGKYISVPIQWALYHVKDEVFMMLNQGGFGMPPAVTLETMRFNGDAKLVAVTGSMTMDMDGEDEDLEGDHEENEEGDPPVGKGPWYNGKDGEGEP